MLGTPQALAADDLLVLGSVLRLAAGRAEINDERSPVLTGPAISVMGRAKLTKEPRPYYRSCCQCGGEVNNKVTLDDVGSAAGWALVI